MSEFLLFLFLQRYNSWKAKWLAKQSETDSSVNGCEGALPFLLENLELFTLLILDQAKLHSVLGLSSPPSIYLSISARLLLLFLLVFFSTLSAEKKTAYSQVAVEHHEVCLFQLSFSRATVHFCPSVYLSSSAYGSSSSLAALPMMR